MAEESILRQAWVLYKQGRFSSALESLEPRVFQFREDPAFFRILGLCCLRLGDWKGGETYLQRSRQLDDTPHRDTLLGLMAVAARRMDYGEAVRLGLAVLDRDPEDKTAKKGLARLRAALAAPEGSPGLDRDTLGQWLPPYRKANPALKRWVVRSLVGAAIAVGLGLGAWGGLTLVGGLPPPRDARPGPGSLPAGAADAVLPGNGFVLTLTADEVTQGWERARKAFQDYHDSRARYEINRLLLSNAGPSVKEKARALLPYLHAPDFSRPDDTSAYQDVKAAPVLYEGCTVRWSGVISNLVSGDKTITFDLLLGYQDGQVVQGIVPVTLGFAALLKNSQVVEVLGRVALDGSRWSVEATSLRELGYRAP
jgi:tetratricopeptide (TPR) repeat protein